MTFRGFENREKKSSLVGRHRESSAGYSKPPVAGILLLPALIRAMPESVRWTSAAATGIASCTHFYDIFVPLYRVRSITLIACSLLSTISSEGVGQYSYFHAVSVVGLPSATASTMIFL